MIKKDLENQKIMGMSRATQGYKQESKEQRTHKEVEDYTRKFEEDKRKLFRAQQNHREVLKDYQNKLSELESMKSKKYKTEMAILNAKIKCLEGNLQKNISSYNDALSRNNSLKNEIDQLRKDKKNNMQAYKSLVNKIQEMSQVIQEKQEDVEAKKQLLNKNKSQILQICLRNQKEKLAYEHNVDQLSKSLKLQDTNKETLRQSGKPTEASDSQPIVKMRLRNLLLRNKEKIKICESYKKNMEKIQQNFKQIQQNSGIQELEEIKNTFLKQDEQSIFIAEYISQLNSDLDLGREKNELLASKIEEQKEKNERYRSMLSGTPEDNRKRSQIHEYFVQKQKPIDDLTNLLNSVSDQVFKTLNKDKEREGQINFTNFQGILAELENKINEQYLGDKKVQPISGQLKQDTTKYSRAAPSFNLQDLRDRSEDGLLQEGKIRDYANQFIKKRKP